MAGTTNKGKNESKRVDLKLEIKDFGPISKGKITIKPLTIFIGPNNSGKSYAAMIVNSIFEANATKTIMPLMGEKKTIPPLFWEISYILKEFPQLKKEILHIEDGGEIEIPGQFLDKLNREVFLEIYGNRLKKEILRSYGCNLKELIRNGKSAFEISIGIDSYNINLKSGRNGINIKDISKNSNHKFKVIVSSGIKESTKNVSEYTILRSDTHKIFTLAPVIQNYESIIRSCFYLPAARSGILLEHKALAGEIIKQSPFVDIGIYQDIPKLSGVVSDLISTLLTLSTDKKGHFYGLAQDFEKELIKGNISIPRPDKHTTPEIKYSFNGVKIPLNRASSTVSELAPLILYLKYLIQPDNVLIIEEPEAHLHPRNQLILAKYLVRMIRRGLRTLITTHSDYLLEQLNNFIMLSSIEPSKYGYNKEDFLLPDEVSAYVFEPDKEENGYKINELDVNDEDGISQEEFTRIYEELYDETFSIRRKVSKDK